MSSIRRIRGATSRAWLPLAAALVAIALPVPVLGATPEGTTGGSFTEPAGNLLDGLLAFAPVVAGIAGAIAIMIIMANVLAGIGGPVGQPAQIPGSVPWSGSRSTVTWRRPWFVVVAGAALVIGVLSGRSVAYAFSQGGLSVLGAGVVIVLLGMGVIGLGGMGLVALRLRHGHLSQAIATVLAAAGLLAGGAIGGGATAAATGGVYRDAVILQASGETVLRLDPGDLSFVATKGGTADCQSDPDGRTVVAIAALDLGELGPGTLRASLYLPVASSEPVTAEFFIDAGDLPEDSIQPSWSGPVLLSGVSADHASGRLAFDGLPRLIPDKMPEAQSSAAIAVGKAWPSSISGELTWSCRPW
ncbi:MAG TPA: hypothetical protein VFY18_03905 [Candidatus Limnocylindrales bacterium]|nr:hypothetical protein [Candidatus Limnocylindrales bacterium]